MNSLDTSHRTRLGTRDVTRHKDVPYGGRPKDQRRERPPLAMAAATASHVASNDSRVNPAPDGSQFPVLPPASV